VRSLFLTWRGTPGLAPSHLVVMMGRNLVGNADPHPHFHVVCIRQRLTHHSVRVSVSVMSVILCLDTILSLPLARPTVPDVPSVSEQKYKNTSGGK
jgi:hypothetical protein